MKSVMFVLFLTSMMFFLLPATSYQTESVAAKELMATISSSLDVEIKGSLTWGGTGYDRGHSIWGNETYLYALGDTNSFGAGGYDFALLKLRRTDGHILWNRTWGGSKTDRGYSIWSDGTYLYTLGETSSFGAGSSDFALIKWDTDGNIIWNRTWGGQGYDRGHSIWGNGTYLYTLGNAERATGSYYTYLDIALVKWDTDGNVIWSRTWGGLNHDHGYSIWGNGTHLYTLGDTRSYGAGDYDFALLKWDTDGNIIWNRTWSGQGYDRGYSIWGNGTHLYTLGETEPTSDFVTYSDLALVKWDTDGNIVWSCTWGGSRDDRGRSIWGDGTYLYTLGDTWAGYSTGYNLVLLKWDIDGNIVWCHTWGGTNKDTGQSVWGDGTYLYTLGYTRSSGDYDVVLVKWGPDITAPGLTNPSDITYSEESIGHKITWTATDYNPSTYKIYQDDIEVASGAWVSGSSITVNVDGLLIGSYDYTIIVYDTSSNSVSNTVIVTVVDTTIPTLTTPSTVNYEQNTTGHNITWVVADSYPDTYIIYKDGTEIAFGNWTSGDTITVNVDGLLPDSYNYTIVVFDFYGNFARDTVIVTVEDTTAPVLNSPQDISYEQGTTGHDITWTAADTNPDTYIIYKDGTEIASGNWTSNSPITVNVDGLLIGSYDYTIIVSDISGNFARDTVIVTVEDTTAPVLNSPQDISYEQSTTGYNITWTVVDANPNACIIYRNGIEIASGVWSSAIPITINVDGLLIGSYDYTIVVSDMYGNSISDTVIVTVSNNNSPDNPASTDASFPLFAPVIAIIAIAVIVVLKRKH